MNHGWQTTFGIWREPTALADPTEPAIRPAGISALYIDREAQVSFTNTNPHGQEQAAEALHNLHRVTMTRAFQADTFTDWLLDAMRTTVPAVQADTPTPGITRTTRETRIDTSNAFFGMDCILADGQVVRLRGMTPTKISHTIETGKITGQSVEFYALTNDNIEAGAARIAAPPLPKSSASPQATFAFAIGADADPQIVPTFTIALLMDREVVPCQFTEEGGPTRYELTGGWRVIGTGTARLQAATAAALRGREGQIATLRADIATAEGRTAFLFQCARIAIDQIGALSDFVHHSLQFMALTTSDLPTFKTITEK